MMTSFMAAPPCFRQAVTPARVGHAFLHVRAARAENDRIYPALWKERGGEKLREVPGPAECLDLSIVSFETCILLAEYFGV